MVAPHDSDIFILTGATDTNLYKLYDYVSFFGTKIFYVYMFVCLIVCDNEMICVYVCLYKCTS